MYKIIPLLLFFLLSFLSFCDGMAVADEGSVKEQNQVCFIEYKNEIQNMIVKIEVDDNNSRKKLFWILPVPGVKDSIKIDIIDNLPYVEGVEIDKAFNSILKEFIELVLSSQIYSAPLKFITELDLNYLGLAGTPATSEAMEGDNSYKLIKTINKFGIKTDLISSKNSEAVFDYFTQMGIPLDEKQKNAIKKYNSNDFLFVISRIDDYEEFTKNNQTKELAVYTEFKTKKIFYPMVLTSTYEKLEIPTSISIVGFVKPILYPELEGNIDTKYFCGVIDSGTKYFTSSNDALFTKIEITGNSSNYSKDLYFEPVKRDDLVIKYLFYKMRVGFLIVYFLITSMIAAGLAGILVFKIRGRKEIFKISLFGISNMLSLIGFILMVSVLKRRVTIFKENLIIYEKQEKRRYSIMIFSVISIIGLIMYIITSWKSMRVDLYFLIFMESFAVAFTGIIRFYLYARKLFTFITAFSLIFLVVSLTPVWTLYLLVK